LGRARAPPPPRNFPSIGSTTATIYDDAVESLGVFLSALASQAAEVSMRGAVAASKLSVPITRSNANPIKDLVASTGRDASFNYDFGGLGGDQWLELGRPLSSPSGWMAHRVEARRPNAAPKRKSGSQLRRDCRPFEDRTTALAGLHLPVSDLTVSTEVYGPGVRRAFLSCRAPSKPIGASRRWRWTAVCLRRSGWERPPVERGGGGLAPHPVAVARSTRQRLRTTRTIGPGRLRPPRHGGAGRPIQRQLDDGRSSGQTVLLWNQSFLFDTARGSRAESCGLSNGTGRLLVPTTSRGART
jgi:hypothetical protein